MADKNVSELTDLTVFIAQHGSELVTDSRAVAIAFKKSHKNVLRAIRNRLDSCHQVIAHHAWLNFEPIDFIDKNGIRQPMYRMTSDGLTELAMSFTGDEACIVRIRFISAFHEVSRRLEEADRSITKMLHDHEKRSVASEAKGRIGSKLMHERRKEKPALKDEEARLLEIVQPSLLN